MPHLHLSLQAGDDLVLKRMRRRHSRGDALAVAARARALRPGIALGADLIAGFPTEDEAMFARTHDLVAEAELDYLHVFPFSPRPGTPAARMPQVPPPLVRERAARLRAAGAASLARARRADRQRGKRSGGARRFRPQRALRPGADRRHGWHHRPRADHRQHRNDARGGAGLSEGGGWFQRLKTGLTRSSQRLGQGIAAIVGRRRLDQAALDRLEELLIGADFGTTLAAELVGRLRRTRFDQEVTSEEVRQALAEEIAKSLSLVDRPLKLDGAAKPFAILVVGVNGSGKTTTIGKLAQSFRGEGRKVLIAACDTFRAAAVEQLQIWGERAGVAVMARPAGADPAGLAFDALEAARRDGVDVLLIDTAGRLHNKANLMAELQKIVRVLKKLDAAAPHAVLLVLDATVGQNAHAQAETFRDMIGVTGLVMTKLDGTAKGGVLVALAEKFGIPVHFIGVGEQADDLRPFRAEEFARSLAGLEG